MSDTTIINQLQHWVLAPFMRSRHRREVRRSVRSTQTAPDLAQVPSRERELLDPSAFAAVSLAMTHGHSASALAAMMYSGRDPSPLQYSDFYRP